MLLVLRAHHAECMDEYDTMLSDHKAYIDVCHKSIAHLRGECAVLTSERDRYVVMSSDMLRAIGGSTTEREALLTELRNN